MIFESRCISCFLHEQGILFDAGNVEIIRLETNSHHQFVIWKTVTLTPQGLTRHQFLLLFHTNHRAFIVGCILLGSQGSHRLANGSLIHGSQSGRSQHGSEEEVITRWDYLWSQKKISKKKTTRKIDQKSENELVFSKDLSKPIWDTKIKTSYVPGWWRMGFTGLFSTLYTVITYIVYPPWN